MFAFKAFHRYLTLSTSPYTRLSMHYSTQPKYKTP